MSMILWRIGAALLAVAALFGGYKFWEHKQQQIGAATQRADDAAKTIAALQASLAEAKTNADETQRRLDAQKESQNEANQARDRAIADAATAGAAADSMRKQLATYVAAHRRAAPSNPAPGSVSPSEPGADPLDLLADLLSRSDQAAGDLAQYADQLRAAGAQCERDYDALTGGR